MARLTRKNFETLYARHQEVLETKLMAANPALKKENVKRVVSEMFTSYRKTSKSNEEAFKKILHRQEFVSKEQIGKENLIKGIKEQGAFKNFRLEVQGWKKKLDMDKLSFDKETGMYKYETQDGDTWYIYQGTTSLGSPEWRWTK